MKMQSTALLLGIESSKGEFEGTKYDSTKFHLSVDLGQKSNGKTLGLVTRPFKFGDSTEIEKWAHLGAHMGSGKPIPVKCDFDVVACWRRFKIEPPCRLNFEPGLLANR